MAAKDTPATGDELEQRLDVIEDLIIGGYEQAAIVRECLGKYPQWDVSERTLRWYCQKVHQRSAGEISAVSMNDWRTISLKRYNSQYHKANGKDDVKGAIAAQDRIVDLLHLPDANFDLSDWQKVADDFGYESREAAYRDWLELMQRNKVDKADNDDNT